MLAPFLDEAFLRGVIIALLGVGFWVGGLVVAYYLWERLRG